MTAQFTAVTIQVGSVSGYSFITNFPFAASDSSVVNMAHCTMTSVGQVYLGATSTGALLAELNTLGVEEEWNEGPNKYMTLQITYSAS